MNTTEIQTQLNAALTPNTCWVTETDAGELLDILIRNPIGEIVLELTDVPREDAHGSAKIQVLINHINNNLE
jgi:hypothetical protein